MSNMVSKTTENSKGYTQCKFENSKIARRLYHIVGFPTINNFKHILGQKIIRNCPVTIDNVNISKKNYGANIGALKGKTTQNRPTHVNNYLVDVPLELIKPQREIIYCIDIMYVNNMLMLTGIDRSLRYCILVPLTSRVTEELYRAIDVVFRNDNKEIFMITDIN